MKHDPSLPELNNYVTPKKVVLFQSISGIKKKTDSFKNRLFSFWYSFDVKGERFSWFPYS